MTSLDQRIAVASFVVAMSSVPGCVGRAGGVEGSSTGTGTEATGANSTGDVSTTDTGATPGGTTTAPASDSGASDEGSSDETTGSSQPPPPPPEGGLGPWGFGYRAYPEIGAGWLGFADFNADGHVDLFVRGSGGVGVAYAGDGAGGFAELSTVVLPSDADFMLAADFDGDGDVNIAVLDDYANDTIGLLPNEGSGTFAAAQIVPLDGFHGFGTIQLDYDQDTAIDMFVPHGHSSGGFVGIAQGDGTFAMGPLVPQPACYFSDTDVGDLDGDGFDDVVATGSCNSIPDGLPLRTYRRVNGEFGLDQSIYADLGPVHEGCDVRMIDVDDDGDLDVVTGTDGGLYLLENVGDGQLEDPPQVLSHDYPGYQQTILPLQLGDGALAFLLQSYEDRETSAAGLVLPSADLTSTSTEILDLQGHIAGSADVDGDGAPDVAVIDGELGGLVSIWLSGG